MGSNNNKDKTKDSKDLDTEGMEVLGDAEVLEGVEALEEVEVLEDMEALEDVEVLEGAEVLEDVEALEGVEVLEEMEKEVLGTMDKEGKEVVLEMGLGDDSILDLV